MYGKFFTVLATAVAVCVSVSCAKEENRESAANKAYVLAAGDVARAASAFNAADYGKSLELCKKAKSAVDEIIAKYPDSSVAFKIITDENLRIGVCKYASLSGAISSIERMQNPAFRPLEFAWIYADGSNEISTFASSILNIEPQKSGEFTRENILKMAEECAKISSDTSARNFIVGLIKKYRAGESFSAQDSESKSPYLRKARIAPSVLAFPEKIGDEKEFFKRAEKAASLVVFDIKSIDELRAMSVPAKNAGGEIAKKFGEVLIKTGKNVSRISVPSVKAQAAEKLAIAFAEFGEETKALVIASELPDGESKTNFIVGMVADIASQGRFSDALEISKILKDERAMYEAYGEIARAASGANKLEIVSEISKITDVNSPNFSAFLEPFEPSFADSTPQEAIKKNIFAKAEVASLFASQNKVAAGKLAEIAGAELKSFSEKYDERDFTAKVAVKLSGVFLALGRNDDALNAVLTNMEKGTRGIMCDYLCRLGIELKKRGENALSTSAFETSATGSSGLSLAIAVHTSGLDRATAVEILKHSLPRFSDIAK